MIDTGLNGRVALVTGANQGIGEAAARALAAQGVAVFLTYLRLDPAEHADEAVYPDAYGEARAQSAEENEYPRALAPGRHLGTRLRCAAWRS